MRRADRLFQIVSVLRARRLVTAEDLSGRLEVSKRTIYRDISDLKRANVPIRGEAGVGYQLDRNYELPPLQFTTDEIEALVLGARMVQAWGDADLVSASKAALVRLEAALPPPLRASVVNTALFAAPFRNEDRTRGLPELRQAIHQQRRVRFTYTAQDGSVTMRQVRPLALYFWGRSWVLAAWCELRTAYRSFRPDRMQAIVSTNAFDPTDGISLDGFRRYVDHNTGDPSTSLER